MAAEAITVVDSSVSAVVPSSSAKEQGIELTETGQMAVLAEEPVKKRSKTRLIAIVVALNVSCLSQS